MSQSLLWFALTEFVLSVSPGPAVFLVLSKSLRNGFQSGMGVTAGVIGVNICYFVLSLVGVGAALAASPNLFLVIKYVGAAYLIWTALHILNELWPGGTAEPLAGQSAANRGGRRGWIDGLPAGVLVQASSIKNLMIFLAIVPQFIDQTGDIAWQLAGLCLVSVVVELPILAGYAYLASAVSQTVQNATLRFSLELASATVLIGIASAVLISAQW